MRKWIVIALIVLTALVSTLIARSLQNPAIRSVDEAILREYAGTYQWDRNAFVYLQIWPELTGNNQLVAFDETGELRILFPAGPDRFFTGAGAAISAPVESRIEVQRGDSGKIASLTWSREGAPARTARRVDIERREDVRFSNGDVQLAGTLITPATQGPHPAVIVHDPAPTIRRLQLPVLALFGELDNNILPEKNRAAWDAALTAGGHRDYLLRILPKANHAMLEAKVGTNAETKSLQRFVPAYSEVVLAWLSKHIKGVAGARQPVP